MVNLHLPQDNYDLNLTKKLETGFNKIIEDHKKVKIMFQQLETFFEEFIEEKKRLREAVERQYSPKLKQKQAELSRQLGAPVHLSADSDPEFKMILNKNMNVLVQRYNEVLLNVKKEIKNMFESSK